MTRATVIHRLETVLKALADPTRLRILALLGSNEVCVCHIHDTLGVSQPTASRHLAYLRRAGLVDARREGVWMHYKFSPSLDPSVRSVVDAAVNALAHEPLTASDRKQYEKTFGRRHVIEVRHGGACCAPRS